MALIAYDGFDHYNSVSDMEQRFGALQYTSLNGSLSAYGSGRGGFGKSFAVSPNYGAVTFGINLSLPIAQITFGMAVNFQGLSGVMKVSMIDNLSGTTQCYWQVNPGSGIIQFYNAAGVLQRSALNSISVNGWYFLEFQNAISTTAGTAALRINGQAIASFPDLTGLNTQESANASASAVGLGPSATILIDDIYVCDGTTGPGSYPNNSFVGDTRCSTLFPISNSSVAWTPLTGTNWSEVDETAMDGDTSYNRTATVGAQDSFNFGTLAVDINQVIGLQITVAVRKEDAGARTVAPVVVLGGTTYQGTAVSVDVTYLYITSIWPINPHTGVSWTSSDVNGMQAGYVVVT
jgi:hypothetical protein